MDRDAFDEVVREDRKEKTGSRESGHSNEIEREYRYKPFVECPRCTEWKLAAHVRQTREESSILAALGDWETAERWWQCTNCEGRFDVE
ncbi:hypothetical protein SAMN04487947_1798 [Halogeometricum rufum]|jgi:hypothetical protein|uniref:Uncharacterized protein n=1 Tax=Halogeometricum rufum TaxID=553469 RepID=A0A1I6GXL1_9EURY|nr:MULTISPECIES: hypothetical protein [Halogeometricum]MUV57926.1 hypothetical protein [Halogeometricum sp. CBA1124]SFR46984.1 hypothetical protein SAMN04487947_1798 [Halogeometricum rufum]